MPPLWYLWCYWVFVVVCLFICFLVFLFVCFSLVFFVGFFFFRFFVLFCFAFLFVSFSVSSLHFWYHLTSSLQHPNHFIQWTEMFMHQATWSISFTENTTSKCITTITGFIVYKKKLITEYHPEIAKHRW